MAAVRRGTAAPEHLLDEVLRGWPAPGQRTVLRALRVLVVDAVGKDADATLEAALQVEDLERDPPLGDGGLDLFLGGGVHDQVVVGAGVRLLPRRSDLAELCASHLPMRGGRELREALAAIGRRDVLEALDARERVQYATEGPSVSSILASLPDFDETDRKILRWIARLADPAPLTWAQRRRADELADLWRTIRLPPPRPLEPLHIVERVPALVEAIVSVAARLSGLPLDVVAAEARVLLDESDGENGTHNMLDVPGRAHRLERWEAITDRDDAMATLVKALGVGQWLSLVAFNALIGTPLSEAELEEVEAVARKAPGVANSKSAALLRCAHAPDPDVTARWLLHTGEAAMRAGVAWFVAARGAHEGSFPADLVESLLDHRDDYVRASFLAEMAGDEAPDEVRHAVAAADWSARRWTCTHCGTINDAGARSCGRCNVIPSDAASAAKALLAENAT